MVNYILSFCKITGASKVFKRHFYLPLLKPLTPKEALRTLKITGKWLLGAKIQHYIPVLLNSRKKRSNKMKTYGKKDHDPMADFTYMTPVLDTEIESHQLLSAILDTKTANAPVYVYTVHDKRYNIVLQSQLENAIRDGDVIDILVSQKNDKIIVKLKNFKKVPMEIQYYDDGGDEKMYCGEGATSPEEEKFHHHGKYTMSLAKIFEDKELMEEKWEEELRKIMRRRKRQAKEGSKEWKEMVKESMKNFDWQKFEEDAKKVIDEIDEPATEEDIDMEIDNLDNTKNVNEILKKEPELMDQLPTMKEIPDIIKNMGNATLTEIEEEIEQEDGTKRRVTGVKVILPSGKECFISGQMVRTEDGDVFVPGQTIENEYGLEYAPGITINVDNKPTLINGLIMGEEERDPMFLPTQSTITSDGNLTFASSPEERPAMTSERREMKKMKKKLKMDQIQEDQIDDDGTNHHVDKDEEICLILDFDEEMSSLSSDYAAKSSDDERSGSTNDVSSIELNSSEMEELDLEAMRLKQEQQRLEIEQLRAILMDDGLEELLDNLEDKKMELKRRLEELRKLRIITKDTLVSYVDEIDTTEIAGKISENPEIVNRLSNILLTMTRKISLFRDKNALNPDNINNQNAIPYAALSDSDKKFNGCSNRLKILLKTAVVAANDVFKNRPKDQIQALAAISDLVVEVLKSDEKLLRDLFSVTNTTNERNDMCNSIFKQLTVNLNETRASTLRNLAEGKFATADAVDKIEKILGKESEIRRDAFGKVAKVDQNILNLLIEDLARNVNRVKNEEHASEILKIAITSAVKMSLKKNLHNFKGDTGKLIEDASAFAKALGLGRICEHLETNSLQDKNTRELLERTLLMRQLAERDNSLKSAIERLKKNPERARYDPRIRQLIKESATLISQPNEPIKNSREIPLQFVKSQNTLAVEDILTQREGVELPVLISRGTFQMVVPKDAERGVLNGTVSYALIDECGVTNFKSIHKFAANNYNKDNKGVRDRSSERDGGGDKNYLQAKSNVRKLKKLLNNSNRQLA